MAKLKWTLYIITLLFLILNVYSTKICMGFTGNKLVLNDDILSCSYTGLKIFEDNSMLDCQGHEIKGSKKYHFSGIVVESENVTIKNCIISDFYNGIEIKNTKFIKVINTTVRENYASGISVLNSSNNTFMNNNMIHNFWDLKFMIF